MNGLVIRDPWICLILSGHKIWEMRSKATAARGHVALIRKGSGLVCGTAELVDCLPPLSRDELAAAQNRHCIPPEMFDQVAAAGWLIPWVLASARSLAQPVAYSHPSGAVTWVNLQPDVARAVLGQAVAITGAVPVSVRIAAPLRSEVNRQRRRSPKSTEAAGSGSIGSAVFIELTGGNLRNNHIYLHKASHLIPPDAIGGGNRRAAAPGTVSVTFEPGMTVETDIAGDKMIFRTRGPVRDFLARSGASEDDEVCIEHDGPRSLRVSLKRKVG